MGAGRNENKTDESRRRWRRRWWLKTVGCNGLGWATLLAFAVFALILAMVSGLCFLPLFHAALPLFAALIRSRRFISPSEVKTSS